MIVLDTDVCIELLRGNEQVILARETTDDSVAVSFLTVGELVYGAQKSAAPERNRRMVEAFLETVPALHTTIDIMTAFGELKADLEKKGTRLADADLLIAATALVFDASLATGNLDHFRRIDRLHLLDWLQRD